MRYATNTRLCVLSGMKKCGAAGLLAKRGPLGGEASQRWLQLLACLVRPFAPGLRKCKGAHPRVQRTINQRDKGCAVAVGDGDV